MNVGIVGCGRVAAKRAAALGGHTLVAVADVVPARAAALAATYPGCRTEERWEHLVARDEVEAVVVATTHDALVPVSVAAVRAGKHVLVEKPGARSATELDELIRAARDRRPVVKVGFNHRYHPALARAKALVDDGAVGDLLYVRGRYGHGGRPGYEREWRADPAVAGGGELLDQGVHLIDLSRWLLGDFTVGKQDQYIAALGGLTCFDFARDDGVSATPLRVETETLYNLEDNLLLFFTGYSRAAGAILKEQDDRSRAGDAAMIENLHAIKEAGLRSRALLEKGDLVAFGELMNAHWQQKKPRAGGMSNPEIDAWYELGLRNGAVGGKLVGAGGGGFLLFYAEDRQRLRHAMREAGLREVRFRFDFEGSKVVVA